MKTRSDQVRRADGAVDKPTTSPQSDLYSEGWERIFGNKDKVEDKPRSLEIAG